MVLGIVLKARKRAMKANRRANGKTIRVTSNVVLLDNMDISKGTRMPPIGIATLIEPMTVSAI